METAFRNTESIIEALENMSNSDLVACHNQMCQNTNDSDNEIYLNDEDFFTTFFDGDVIGAVRAATYGDYSFPHDWVKFNGYANLESFDNPEEYIDLSEIAEYILENESDYSWLIELEDEEEDEEDIEEEDEE